MYIEYVLQKTYVEVDEAGTEAAAVTAVAMAKATAVREDDPLEVRFDRPFTFVIYDHTHGEVLFMGEYAYAV